MPNHVYAHLVYGFVALDDDGENPAEESPPSWLLKDQSDENSSEEINVQDIVARLENIQPPDESYDEHNEEVKSKYADYWKRKRDAEKASGIVIVDHCRSEHPMWILGVAESHKSEWRGEVGKLGQKIEAKPEWRELLKTFCERAGIPFSEPEWLLAPYSE